MGLTEIITGLLISVAFVMGFGLFISSSVDNYDLTLSNDFNSTLNNFSSGYEDLTSTITEGRNESFSTQATQDTDSGINLVQAVKTTKNMITNTFGVTGHLLENLEERFGLPSIWKQLAIGILLLTLIIIFVSAVLNNRL